MTPEQYEKFVVGNSLTGTDAEIVAQLSTLTSKAMLAIDVAAYFRETDLWEFDSIDGKWVGKLTDAAKDPNTPALLLAGIRDLGSVLNGSSETLATNTLEISSRIAQVVGGLLALGHINGTEASGFWDLAGGQPFASLTEEQLGIARAGYDQEQTANGLRRRYDDLFNVHAAPHIVAGNKALLAQGLRDLADEIES